MSILDDIRTKLPAVMPDQPLVLNASDLEVPQVTNFFNEGLKVETLTFTEASQDKADDLITITGTAMVLGYQGLTVTLTFQMQDETLTITLDGVLPADKNTLQLPLVNWIRMENLGLSLTQRSVYDIRNFVYQGDIVLDSETTIPIALSPSGHNMWQLDIAQDSEFSIGDVSHLTRLLNGNAPTSFVPNDRFDVLNNIKLGHISSLFNPIEKTIMYFTLGVGVSDGWPIIEDKLEIKQNSMRFIFTLVNPTDEYNRRFIGIVKGTIVISTIDVPVFIQANLGRGTTTWRLGLDPASEGVTLPSFSDLFALAGGEDFKNSLPAGLRDLPQINISNLEIDFSLNPNHLQLITFAARTTSPWPVIEGFFTVENLQVALTLLNLDDANRRQVEGMIYSTFTITDSAPLFFTINKNPHSTDWTLSGGLAPGSQFDLVALIDKLLGDFVTLPDSTPAIIFDTANATVIPGKQMSLTAGSQSTWSLLPDHKFEVDYFTLNFVYDQQAAQNEFSGSLETVLTIAEVSIHIRAALDKSGGSGWQFEGNTGEGQAIPLGRLIAEIGEAVGDITLPPTIAALTILNLRVSFNTKTKDFMFTGETKMAVLGQEIDLVLTIDIKRQVRIHLAGTIGIFGSEVQIEGEYDDSITLAGSIDSVNFTGIVAELLPDLTLPAQVPDITFKDIQLTVTPETGDFSLFGQSADPWVIPLGFEDLSIEGLSISLRQTTTSVLPAISSPAPTQTARSTSTKQLTGAIGGTLRLGTMSTTITYKIPGRFMIEAVVEHVTLSEIISSICGPEILPDLMIPVELLGMEFRKIGLNIAPQDAIVSFVVDSDFGTLEFMAKQGEVGWNFIAGLAPPDTFKFSAIDPGLAGLDDINMSGTAIIIASNEDRTLRLTEIATPGTGVTIKPGVNLFANFETSGTGVDEVLGLERLQIYAVIGAIEDIVIAANIEGEFKIADDVYLRQVTLAMRPSPLEIKLYGNVTATLNDSPLVFTAGLEVSPRLFTLEGTMTGRWQDPFGAKGIAVENLALEFGVTWPPPLPTIAFAGKLYVGEFAGELAAKFNAAQINNSMLVINFNYLHICDVLDALVDPAVAGSISPVVRNEILDLSFNDVDIYIVPTPTTIANIAYDQGIRFGGKVNAWGFNALLDVQVDYTAGLYIYAEIRPFDLAGILQISGADGPYTSAIAEVDLRLGKQPLVYISGMVSLLGASSAVKLIISEAGFQFTITRKLFDLFEAELFVAGGNFDGAGGVLVRATMRNDLFEYLRKEASAYIDKVSKDAVAEIEKAKRDLREAQNEVNRINRDIEATRQRLYRYRIDHLDGLIKDRTNTRNRAINEMNKYQRQYDSHYKTVKAQRDKDTRALTNARNDVTNKRNALSSLQTQINNKKNRRDQYRREAKNNTDKMWGAPILSSERATYEKRANEAAANATALDFEITGLEIEKTVAEAALILAQGALDAVLWIQTAPPITADPKLVQLATFVEANRISRDDLNNQIQNFNREKDTAWQWVDANVEVLTLIGARETALAGLRVAEDFLSATQDVVAFSADVAKYIVDFGFGGLIDIRYAVFEGRLMEMNGGNVMLAIGIQFMGGDVQHIGLTFNFDDRQGSAKQLGQQLLSQQTLPKPGVVALPEQQAIEDRQIVKPNIATP